MNTGSVCRCLSEGRRKLDQGNREVEEYDTKRSFYFLQLQNRFQGILINNEPQAQASETAEEDTRGCAKGRILASAMKKRK